MLASLDLDSRVRPDRGTELHRAAARATLVTLNRPIASRRFRRALKDHEGSLRINVGCGRAQIDGWLNTDIDWRARLYLDATRPWPVRSGSVTHIYADQVIEHLRLPAARRFLAHAYTALAEGGGIRLTTPDVERTARIYLDNPELAVRHLERHRSVGYQDVVHRVDLLRVTFAEAGHHRGYMYDFEALADELEHAGFRDVVRHPFGLSGDPAFCGLEGRVGETVEATILIVEARKPLGGSPGT